MALGKGLKGFSALAVALFVGAPSVANAHAHLTNPPSRAGTDNATIKIPQCGGLPRGATPKEYNAGATITVEFDETIGHQGCFQVKLGDKNDANWVTLKQVNDPAGSQGKQTMMVTLPNGFTCTDCTLQLLQLMNDNGTPCAADAGTAASSIYYSCADIRVMASGADSGPPATDSGTSSSGGAASSSSGSTTTPTDGGGNVADPDDEGDGFTPSRNLQAGKGGDCNVGFGDATGASLFITAGFGALAMLRRRKKR